MAAAFGPVILIVSPHAGSAQGVDPQLLLRQAGVEVGRVIDVHELKGQPAQGQAWRDAGARAVVAAGGDGTVGSVASHLANTGLPLGIVPLGTANDIARSLDIPMDLAAAGAVIAGGHTTTIDLGRARPDADTPGATIPVGGDAFFLHALTLGWNVAFAQLATNVAQRQRWGPLNYAVSAVEAALTYRPVTVRIQLDGVMAGVYGLDFGDGHDAAASDTALTVAATDGQRTVTGSIVNLAVIVTPVFGGRRNLRLPNVNLHDHLVDLVLIEAPDGRGVQRFFESLSERQGMTDSADATLGNALDRPGVWRFQARNMRIETPETPGLTVTLDGEPCSRTPLDVSVAPDALQVLVPAAASEASHG